MDVAALCHLYPVVLQLQQLLPTLLARAGQNPANSTLKVNASGWPGCTI